MSNSNRSVLRDQIPAPKHPESHEVIRDIVHNAPRMLLASTTALAFISSSVHAQEGPALDGDRPVPICGTIEYVEVDGRIVRRQVTEGCDGEYAESAGQFSGLGIAVGGLLIAGLAAAGGSSGGGDGGSPGGGDDGSPGGGDDDSPGGGDDGSPGGGNDGSPGGGDDGSPGGGDDGSPGGEDDGSPGGEDDGSPGGGSDGNTPSIPRLHPRPSVLPLPGNPDDPASWRTLEFDRQFGLALTGVEHRFAQGARGQGTLGAIYDSGIDLTHIDVGGIRLDLSHNYSGRPDDITDTHGHGTHVYGIAGASRNGIGIHGIAPEAEFMILRQVNDRLPHDLADALRRVTDAGADAMNNSWASYLTVSDFLSNDALLTFLGTELIEQLRNTAQAGVSVVFVTGNNSRPDASYLASIPVALPELAGNWIAVTSLNNARDLQSTGLAGFANKCGNAMNWCLAAPGLNITSLDAGGGTVAHSGTSFAAPHVMGAVLVLKSRFPELTTPEVHQLLFDTAFDLGAPGVDPIFGHGALNLNEALTPQGQLMVELGPQVDQTTAPLSSSRIVESAITGGVLAKAMSDQRILVTDSYDRGYFASLGPRIATGSFAVSPDIQAGLAAAFSLARDPHRDLPKTGFDLRFDAFGPDHDVTRIAHADPVMALVSQTTGTGFSLQAPIGKATLSVASATTTDGSAISLGAGLPFGDDHTITVSVGSAQETDSLLGAKAYGAFAGLDSETIYGRVLADVALGERITLNGSVATGRTSFRSTGLLSKGRTDTLAMALGLTFTDALARGDKLSLALARPFAVSGGQITLRSGIGISPSFASQRTNRVQLAETTLPLGASTRAPELHLGYLHSLKAGGWANAALAFGGIARLDGGARMAAARIALTFEY